MPSKVPSIAIGVAAYVVLSVILSFVGQGAMGNQAVSIALGALGCVLLLGCAAAAVWHYTTTHALTLAPGQGAGMGALVGLIGAVIGGVIGYAMIAAGLSPDPMEAARAQMEGQGMSEEEIEQAMQFAGAFSSPLIGIATSSVIGLLGGALGGVLGAVMFKRGDAVDY